MERFVRARAIAIFPLTSGLRESCWWEVGRGGEGKGREGKGE